MALAKAKEGLTTHWSGRATQRRAAHRERVCRAWHRAGAVQGLAPGVRAAEGEEQSKGATARWGLEEAQAKEAGRRTDAEPKMTKMCPTRAQPCSVWP
jgi:hypothetical protein